MGGPKRRVWRKIHLGIDEETLEIRAVEITRSHIGDAPVLPHLLSQIPIGEEVGSVTADGAYDTRKCHDAIADRGAHAVCQGKGPPDPFRAFLTPAPEERRTVEDRHRRRHRPKRGPARREIPRPGPLATMERIPPQEPRRDMRRHQKTIRGIVVPT
ncbi:transposase, partial [Tritonibacter sp. SIMBA_163]|uniref:transposase n=1 Tax=Tritonibacter sp. SIMBA_163 TaxID=3080868 RepID=UPI00397F1470